MQWLFESFRDVQPWHWLALGAILVGIEIVSPTFYFLWPGLAAGVVGIALYFFPALSPQSQIILFAILAVLTTVAWKRFAPADWTSAEPHPTLNRRTIHYVGRRARVAESFSGGRGAVLIDDTRWSAMTEDGSDPALGEMVTVTGSDGSILKVVRKAD
jgi:inner membrane protein